MFHDRWEIAANGVNAASILLATFNSAHTWWTGIVGCVLFCWVFLEAHLYADATLQIFFIATSAIGWWNWLRGNAGEPIPVRGTTTPVIALYSATALAATAAYSWLLHTYTSAYAPVADSAVLTSSMVGQLLLIARRWESWWFWLAANSIAVPLFLTRGLNITGVLYSALWINSLVALLRWRRLVVS